MANTIHPTAPLGRRGLIQGAALLGAATLLPFPLSAAPLSASSGDVFDVAVVGSGAGGFTAAIRAAESGARVVLIEANTWLGGASRVATGIFGCAGHPIQKALGFTNGPEDLYKLYISEAAATKTRADESVARILADGAIPAADWLASLGVEWSTQKAQKFFLNIKEGHRLGEYLIDALEKKARALEVTIVTSCRAEKLLVEQGRIAGVECSTPTGKRTFTAGAVVLASGGFEANPEMIARHIGNGWEKAGVYCTPTNRGDGQRMAQAIGADLVDMKILKANPTIHVSAGNRYNLISAVRAGAVAVGHDGTRFFNELGGYWQSYRIWAQPDHCAWLLFGDPVIKADPRLEKLVASGTIHKTDSIETLAEKIGLDPANLAATVAQYRKAVGSGTPDEFGRKPLKDPFGGSWYAAKIEPMIQGTFGGVKTNPDTEVLTSKGDVIPGLYAIGECAANGLRGVNPQTANIVFGSIAGRRSAAFVLNRK